MTKKERALFARLDSALTALRQSLLATATGLDGEWHRKRGANSIRKAWREFDAATSVAVQVDDSKDGSKQGRNS